MLTKHIVIVGVIGMEVLGGWKSQGVKCDGGAGSGDIHMILPLAPPRVLCLFFVSW